MHRDLACRNVLLGENKQLKVSDFGLAREGELYVKTTAGRLPLRWMAIEAITERVFTQKTDVWVGSDEETVIETDYATEVVKTVSNV